MAADDDRDRENESLLGAGATSQPGHEPPSSRSAAGLPAGTVTFLLTDIEGSTRLWESVPEAMEVALERHNRLVTEVIEEHGGVVVTSRGEGDSFFAVFPSAVAAVEAAGACQLTLAAEAWPEGAALRVRMGLHTGEAHVQEGDYGDHAPINRCARVKAAAHGGQVLVTSTTRNLVGDRPGGGFALRRLGEFRLRDLAEPELIYQLIHAELPADFPPIRTLAERTSNLPIQVSSFIGRDQELSEVRALAESSRLVTLTGAGGSGKTRLGLQLAAKLPGRFSDGVWLVELAAVAGEEAVAPAICQALGIVAQPGRPAGEVLADALAPQELLIVLDNCEHLVGGCAKTADAILRRCPRVRLLATSREPLGIGGEAIYRVPPLSLPGPGDTGPVAARSSDAVALFAARANEQGAGLPVDEQTGPLIASICARLDGLPLAIELAAARATQLDLDQLAAALKGHLELSWLGSRTAHARQQTLAATIGWSYDLLTAELRAALKRLAVFSGGFTLEAAGAVTGTAGKVTETVTALAARSLIAADRPSRSDGPGTVAIRYRMLETIRQYCAGRIADEDGPGGQEAARDAHSRFFADLARRASAALTGWHQGKWLTILEADYANLVAALNHLLRPSRAGEALQTIVHMDRFWHNRGHLAECAALLRRSLDIGGQDVGPAIRCGALNLAGQAALNYDSPAARSYFTESLDIARRANDDFHAAGALWGLAALNASDGDLEGGRTHGKAAVDLARALGDPVLLGECLTAFGRVAGDPPARRAICEEALAVTRRSGDRINTAWSHNNLSDAAEDDLEAERYHLEQAQAIFRELGAPQSVPVANLGWCHLRQNNLSAADAAFAEALHTCELTHDRRVASYVILGFACAASAQREWERAARLFGFADAELEDCGMSWPEPQGTAREQSLAEVQQQLAGEFDRSYDSGRTHDRRDLINYTLNKGHIP